jgi:hypothetical protein
VEDPVLLILLLKGAFVALASAGLAAGLAWSARGEPRSWPVTGALLLGSDRTTRPRSGLERSSPPLAGHSGDHGSAAQVAAARRGFGPPADDEVDLRFRAFLAGVLAVIVGALVFPDAVRGLATARLVLGLALALPLVTALLAAAT